MTRQTNPLEAYISGQWAGINRVLNLLNTFDTKEVSKKDLYHAISELRPVPMPLD